MEIYSIVQLLKSHFTTRAAKNEKLMAQKDVGNKVPIYKLKKTEEVMRYYDEWGEGNKYDKDMVDWNYTGPKKPQKFSISMQKTKLLRFLMQDAGQV